MDDETKSDGGMTRKDDTTNFSATAGCILNHFQIISHFFKYKNNASFKMAWTV